MEGGMDANTHSPHRLGHIVTALVLCGGIAAMATIAATSKGTRQAPATREQRQKADQVRATSGIRAAAAVNGSYVKNDTVDDVAVALDINSLLSRSDIVARGVIKSNVSHVSEDGAWVVTDYVFSIAEELFSPDKHGATIHFRLPGGRVEWDDGTYADIKIPGFRHPLNGKEYLLFLAKDNGPRPHDAERYKLAMGSQSAFELGSDGLATALGKKIFPV